MEWHGYVVKRVEEELGTKFLEVFVPSTESEESVMKNLSMAAKYAKTKIVDWKLFDEEEKSEYDEHLEEMGKLRSDVNGDYMFEYYLTNCCGYKVDDVYVDFEYEW